MCVKKRWKTQAPRRDPGPFDAPGSQHSWAYKRRLSPMPPARRWSAEKYSSICLPVSRQFHNISFFSCFLCSKSALRPFNACQPLRNFRHLSCYNSPKMYKLAWAPHWTIRNDWCAIRPYRPETSGLLWAPLSKIERQPHPFPKKYKLECPRSHKVARIANPKYQWRMYAYLPCTFRY